MQENRFAVFEFKVTVRAQMIKYMTVSGISIEQLIFLHPNLVGWHIIISLRGVLFFVVVVMCVSLSVYKLDCCFQGQGLREGSKLY